MNAPNKMIFQNLFTNSYLLMNDTHSIAMNQYVHERICNEFCGYFYMEFNLFKRKDGAYLKIVWKFIGISATQYS